MASKYIYKLLKLPFFGRFMVQWKNPLTNEQQLLWQSVKVRSKSGAAIIGLFRETDTTKTRATIVLGHPMGKEAKGYFLKNGYTDFLLQNGYNVLIFDLNGFGESENGNFSYHEDIIAIGRKAKELSPGLQIGYHGISLGGQMATIAFCEQGHTYDFAIIESAATSLDEFWVKHAVAFRMLKMLNVLLPKYRKKILMIERIKEIVRPDDILFIYSLSDEWTPVSMGKRFQKNCAVPSELWTVPDAKHAMIMKSASRELYKEKILEYLGSRTRVDATP